MLPIVEEQMEVDGEDSDEESAFDDLDDDIILGDDSQDHQQRNAKRRVAFDSEATESAIVTAGVGNSTTVTGNPGLKSFWQNAFALSLYGNSNALPPEEAPPLLEAPPPEELIDELSTAGEHGTEEVDFMDSERLKDARLAQDQGEGNRNKKNKPVLQDDEAVWGANGPMGPHYKSEWDEIHDL